tara:strand:- start:511908 stop:513098 length:1191 start_codon:yes stop_codon:yes gene_type:complete
MAGQTRAAVAENEDAVAGEAVGKGGPAFGPCKGYIQDSAKSLFGPMVLPALNATGRELHVAKVNMPTHRAKHERSFRTLKNALRQHPMPVVDMIRARELNYNVGENAITMSQLRDMIEQFVDIHNRETPGPDGRTPNQILAMEGEQFARPVFTDIDRVERAICTTDQAILDNNGVVYDGLRYRDKEKVARMILNMKHLGPDRVTKRKDGRVGIVVKIMRNPGNLFQFKVFDEIDKEWIDLPSTEPEFTWLLSAGEHQLFQKRAKERNDVIRSAEDRLAAMARTQAEMEAMVPDLQFQQRRRFANIWNSDRVAAHTGKSFEPVELEDGMVAIDLELVKRADNGLPNDEEFSIKKAMKNSSGFDLEETSDPAFEEPEGNENFDDIDLDDIDLSDEEGA